MSDYEIASIILQIFVSIAAFGALIIYYRQLRVMSHRLDEMQRSSKTQGGLSLVDFLQAPEVRSARHVVRNLTDKPLEYWSEEERSSASVVTSNYDVAAALIRNGLAPVELIAGNWGPSIRHCYEILLPYIEEQRSRPGADPNYWGNFKWLYKKSKEINLGGEER